MKLNTLCLAAAMSASALSAQAAENGNTQYSPGASQFFAGGMPPYTGFYLVMQTSYFSSDRTNDKNGDRIPIDFEVKAIAETFRFLYISDIEIAKADLFFQLVVPVVHLDMTVPYTQDKSTALADITVSTGLAWHPDQHNTFVAGLDVSMPTGQYDVSELASVGTNHWSFQPTLAYHYLDPEGFEFGAAARLIVNTENPDTDYTTGNELVVDYAIGWNIDKFRIGAVGYYLQQLTDDEGPGVAADGHRGKGFAIGPSLTYNLKPGLQLSASWQHDVVAENRAQGNTVWVNFATKF